MQESHEDPPQSFVNYAVLIAVVAVSFSAILIRWSDAHPFVIAAYRMGITSLILLPLVLARYLPEIRKIERNELLFMMAIGMILALHFGSWIASLNETSVASSVILVTSHPLFVAIVSHYIFREKLQIIGYLGIIIAFVGIIILTVGDFGLGGSNLMGDVLALIGSIAAGIYILGGRRARKSTSLIPYVFIIYSTCTICLLAACFAVSAPLYPLSIREYELFILMAIIPTILGHTFYNYALKFVKAQLVSVSLLGEPIGSSILAYILLSEPAPRFTILGGALILPGIYLAYIGRNVRKNN